MARSLPPTKGGSNTRDQLRGAHDLTLVHDDVADDDAFTRLQPPLVSCIALFGNAVHPLWAAFEGATQRTMAVEDRHDQDALLLNQVDETVGADD
jgi:geranylgeranyl pyrophosphate synthase